MIGRDPNLQVSTRDDEFHPPTLESPSWIETMWFPCWIQAENLSISIRLWFAANMHMRGGAVSAWTNNNEVLFGDKWAEECSDTPDMTQLTNLHGVSIHRVESLNVFDVSYKNNEVDLQFRFDSIMPPNPVPPSESPGMFLGHFEQAGRATGSLKLGSKEYSIDCYTLRDRSWGPRQMPEELRLGNAYGANANEAFFCYINPDAQGREIITSGYYIRDGESAVIKDGLRTVHWNGDTPESVDVYAVDALGRELKVSGHCRNVMAANAGSGVYGVLNLMQWYRGDKELWGENHDIWSENLWLAVGRKKL